jgi:hypothetical protein
MTTARSTKRNHDLGWMRLALGALTTAGTLAGAQSALAQTKTQTTSKAAAPSTESAAAAPRDVITLKNGNTLRGWVSSYRPGEYVIVKTDEASVTIAAGEILSVAFTDRGPETGDEVAARVIVRDKDTSTAAAAAPVVAGAAVVPVAAAAASATPAAAAARPSIVVAPSAAGMAARPNQAPTTTGAVRMVGAGQTTEKAWLSTKQGTVGHSTTSAAGTLTHQADLKRGSASREEVSADGRERSVTQLNALTKNVSHGSSTNCSTAADPNCTQSAEVSLGADGIGASVSKTQVTRVQAPPSGYVVFGVDGGVLGIQGDSISGIAGTGSFGVRGAVGGKMPGSGGGGWSGLGIDASLAFTSGQIEMTLPSYSSNGYYFDEQTTQVEYMQGSAGAALGWQYLHFGKLDSADLTQGGIGFFLGYRAGAVKDLKNDTAPVTLSHGPQIALSFPTYNAGTAHVSDMTLKGMILPTGDLTLFAVTFGFGF